MKGKSKRLLAVLLAVVMVQWYYPMGTKAEVQAAGAGTVSVTQDENAVVIGNDYISRQFSIANDKLETVSITNKRTDGGNTVFSPAEGSEEFVVKVTAGSVPTLNKSNWTAYADSYQDATVGASDGPPAHLIDGNTSTIWHSAYNSSGAVVTDPIQGMPKNVVITMGEATTFQAFGYTGRSNGSNGRVNGFNLYIYNGDATDALAFDAAEWGEPVLTGNFEDSSAAQFVNLAEKVTATQIRLEVTSSYGDQADKFASGAEIDLAEDAVKEDRDFAASELELNGAPVVDNTTATINGVEKTGKKVTFNFAPFTFKGVEYTISENIVMYNGDHFMRKYLEISVPESKKNDAVIDYIDLESLKVNVTDATWTIPTDAGGVVAMEQFKANLGQPIYIQGMFFGCAFPAADTEIVDGTGYMRYYTGKSFDRLVLDSQAAAHDGVVTYNTWQTVAGAARSTENEVIQADFFEYIKSIATPSEFRIQYNSWFDNMMLIDDDNILESFIEIDRELNAVETRPLDSYVVDDGWNNYNKDSVVDAGRSGNTLNTTGFWEFNDKFPNKLTPSSELVQNFGSNFGVWIGPRGGYNFQWSIADILVRSGKGSKAGGSIDVADREYVKNFQNMAIEWQEAYGVNYWKWDGFADGGQYGDFGATDGVPGYANRHMTGGYHNMYHVTDLWEAWIDLMEACRKNAEDNGIKNLWISLTCYVHPSPWFLQWANSVWIQCVYDQKDAGFGSTKMNKQITYRDAMYFDFIKNHEFQFPLSNVYNHDPVYGKEGTGMDIDTATDEDFKNYLYMLSTRGTAFWELYYSDSIMTEGEYEVTSEFLAWAEENYHMLKNSKMIGGAPDVTLLSNGASDENQSSAYGFSCFDGTDGILSLRNPSTKEAKTIEFTFDRTMGVAENAGTLKYHLEHSYNLADGTTTTGTLEYGQTYSITLQPNEVRILRVSKDGDTTAPSFTRAYTDGNKTITVKFDEKVTGMLFTVDGANVSSVEKSADGITYHITLTRALTENKEVTVTARDIKDLAGNALAKKDITVTYRPENVVVESTADAQTAEIAASANALSSNNGFTVVATVETAAEGAIVAQGNEYELGINAEGKAYFKLNGATAVSKDTVADGAMIVGVKENNGILKLYVNGTLAGSAYNAANRYYDVKPAAITAGGTSFGSVTAGVYDTAYGYDKVAELAASEAERTPIPSSGMTVTVSGTSELSGNESASDVTGEQVKTAVFDSNNTDTFWTSNVVDAIAAGNPYLTIDLGATYMVDRVDYTKRYHSSVGYNCTGNITQYVVEVSNNGQDWEQVSAGATVDGTTEISFEAKEARYVRISGTASYFWLESGQNKRITIADLAVYGESKVAENIALNKTVTAAWTADGSDAAKGGDCPMSKAVDGINNNTYSYGEFGADNRAESSYMQVDLGKVCEIESINLYRYWSDARIYKNTVLAIGKTEADFANGTATIVYNTDGDNVHGLGVGNDTQHPEGASGRTFTLDEAKEGRYVRVYMNGTTSGGTTNHVVEIEVMGYEPAEEENETETGIDITAFINRLVELTEKDTSNSTTDSVNAYKALVKEGYDLLSNGAETQEEVNAMLTKLEGAENVLVARGVTTALATLIESYAGLVETDYTVETWAAYKRALDAAQAIVDDNSNITEADVNTAKTALENAKNALVEVPKINRDDLKAAIDAAKALNKDSYTTASYNAMKAKLDAAEAVYNTTEVQQADVDAAKDALNAAVAGLVLRGNTAELANLINSYKDLVESDYTAATWEAYKTALDAAQAIVDDNSNSTQADVKAAKEALQNAKNALEEAPVVPVINKAELKKAINAAKKVNEEEYTVTSYNAMKAAYDRAVEFDGSDTVTQDQVDEAAIALNDAVKALVKRADVTNAQELLDEIAEEDLAEEDYTAESWKSFTDAKAALAAAVKDNSDVDAETMAALVAALRTAKTGLVEVEKPVVVDKDELKESYEAIVDKKNDGYTAESWAKFQNALLAAQAILDNPEATEEQVAAALAQLRAAEQGLVKDETPSDKDDNKENNDKENNDKENNDKQNDKDTVATGDHSSIMLWGILMMAAVVAVIEGRKRFIKRS